MWALSWSHDDNLIATASRENKKSVKIWQKFEVHSVLPSGAVPCATSI